MKKIRVVQVGTWAYTHSAHTMLSMRSMPQIYDVAGICEPNEQRRLRAINDKAYEGLSFLSIDEVLADKSLDAVIIETSELEQAQTALLFAEQGFNIHVDKPGGESTEDFKKLVDTVKKNNVVFQMGYMYRYNPAIMQAIEQIKNGKIGDIISTEAHMSTRYGLGMLDWLGSFKGGMMFYLGCHLVDLMYLIQGEPNKITVLNTSSGTDGTKAKDFGFSLYHYERGTSLIKVTACETNGSARRQLVISGTKGTIEIKPIEDPIIHNKIPNANRVKMTMTYNPELQPNTLRTEEYICSPFGRYDDMMYDFAKMVCGEKTNPYSPDYELKIHSLILKTCGIN